MIVWIGKSWKSPNRNWGRRPFPIAGSSYGSEGRKEQTFKTDQDNALIYNDPATAEEEEKARDYFAQFTALVNPGPAAGGLSLVSGRLYGQQSQVVPAPQGLEEVFFLLD